MQKLSDVRVAANAEKRDMLTRGTQYRKDTAVYTSRLLNELVSSNHTKELTGEELIRMAKDKYQVDNDRAADIAKRVLVHSAKVRDRDRLAKYYRRADEILNK